MAQFDVYLRRDRARSYMVDVQTDFLSDLDTRLVIPLIPDGRSVTPASRLNPCVLIDDVPHILATNLATTVPRRMFGQLIMSLAEHRDEIVASIDFLITGV